MKIVKNTAAVSSILSSTISVLVATVINSPENANKRDKGNVGGREATALFHASYSARVFAREREGVYIYIYTFYASKVEPHLERLVSSSRSRFMLVPRLIINTVMDLGGRFRSLESIDRAKL